MNELLIRLSAGEDVVNEVITHEIKLAQKLAHRFRIKYPNKKMDITSVALLALVRGVNTLQGDCKAEYIEPTLNRMIRNAIITFLNSDNLIPVPRGSKYDAEKRGEFIIMPLIFSIDRQASPLKESSHKTTNTFEIPDNTYCEMVAGKELREDFDCRLDKQEKQNLEARLKGLSLIEIATSRKCSPQFIGQLLKNMREKCYAVSIYSERESLLQGRWILQQRKAASKTNLPIESVYRPCAT